jgi:ubiquinone biosynthesis protein UbiJ
LLNKLLQREAWARERLSRHSGKTARFIVGSFKTSLTIQAGGLVQASDTAIVPDVILTIPAGKIAELPAVLRARDPALIASLMHIEGDAALAQLASDLARDLRWDVEDDLSGLLGDVAARRLMQAGRSLSSGVQTAATRLAGNVSEFISEESGMVTSRPAFDDFVATAQKLRESLDRLDARVSRLTMAGARSPARKG